METTASAIGFRFLLLTKGSGSVRAKPSHFARWRANTPHGVRYSARRRAVKTSKSAKGVWGKTRVFPHKQHIKSSRDYPPKQSGGLFRKHITHLNYSFQQPDPLRSIARDFFISPNADPAVQLPACRSVRFPHDPHVPLSTRTPHRVSPTVQAGAPIIQD